MPPKLSQLKATSHIDPTNALLMAVGGKEGMKEATDVCLVAWGSAQRQVGDKSRGVPTPPSTSRD